MNYGSHPDFLARWLKSAAINYLTVIPLMVIVMPPIQRFVLRRAGLPTP